MATYQSQYTGAQIDAAVGAAMNPDTTLSKAGKAADAKTVGDALYKSGDEITFPSAYTGKASINAISGRILTGGHNLIEYIGFVNGTYTASGLTITISGNEISLNGTSTKAIYFAPHLGADKASSASDLSHATDYTMPSVNYRFGAKFENVSNAVSLCVRSRTSGNLLTATASTYYATGIYNYDTWGEIYLYIPSGTTISNGKITVGLIPASVTYNFGHFTEYNDIQEITAIGIVDLSVYSILDGTATVYEIVNAIDELRAELAVASKMVYVKYVSGSGLDGSAEKVEVYIPANIGYIRFDFLHSISPSINCNIWRIGYAYAVDNAFAERFALTTAGEWECALHLKDRADFSGGYAHGDEVVDNITFFVDGVPVDITDFTDRTAVSSLSIVQTSSLYDPADSTTIIATHGSEHIFKDKVTINQSIKWAVAEHLTACYLAMFPVAKTVTDSMYTNKDYNIVTLDGSTKTAKGATAVNTYSASKGFNALFAVDKYPSGIDADADYFLTTDNGGGAYNKCYYVIATNSGVATTTVNEEWKAQTIYDLQLSK